MAEPTHRSRGVFCRKQRKESTGDGALDRQTRRKTERNETKKNKQAENKQEYESQDPKGATDAVNGVMSSKKETQPLKLADITNVAAVSVNCCVGSHLNYHCYTHLEINQPQKD